MEEEAEKVKSWRVVRWVMKCCLWTWHGHCTHELTAGVATCTRSSHLEKKEGGGDDLKQEVQEADIL